MLQRLGVYEPKRRRIRRRDPRQKGRLLLPRRLLPPLPRRLRQMPPPRLLSLDLMRSTQWV